MNRLYRDMPITAALIVAVLIIGLVLPGSIIWKFLAIAAFLLAAWMYCERIGIILLIASQSLFQTVFYYLGWTLGSHTDAWALAAGLLLLLPLLVWQPKKHQLPTESEEKPNWYWIIPLLVIGVLLGGGVVYASFRAATDVAIRSPWVMLPFWTIPACASLVIASLLAAWKSRSRLATAVLVSITSFAISAIAPALYELGFGFDGFLHRASEHIILDTGTLDPKPPYYIGQYVFTTWLARFSALDISLIDRWLVPVFFALIPFFFLSSRAKSRDLLGIPALLLLIPLAPFVATTPQSFAYIIGLISILISLDEELHPFAWLPLALWSIAIHPLAGLPFAAIAGALFCIRLGKNYGYKPITYSFAVLGVIAAGLSIPAAFLLLGSLSSNAVVWDWSRIIDMNEIWKSLSAFTPPQNRVALWADWSSLVGFLILPASILLAIISIFRDRDRRAYWIALLAAGCSLLAAGFILKAAGEFPFLIDYERGNYTDRLSIMANLIVAIPAAAGLGFLLSRLSRTHILTTCYVLCASYAWMGAQTYNALPRHDAAQASRGWSVGRSDIDAVRWIEQDAGKEPYTVLANQSVSAAAVQELGFKRYAGDVFFYPIPTGGALYQEFLQAVAPDPSFDAIQNAARLGESKIVYVVLNEYWWDAERVASKLSAQANSERDIKNGTVRVYKFLMK
ncbi:hypothetical protein IT407_03070 [Candidatus Uhrbacteria bacterium]|nr:hypothetical protein [Candidatus Uhrbacteria bacterium]